MKFGNYGFCLAQQIFDCSDMIECMNKTYVKDRKMERQRKNLSNEVNARGH